MTRATGNGAWTLAVDVGTTFTAAATRSGDTVERVPFGSGTYLPSVVCVDNQGELLTGPEAVAEAVRHPERAERLPKKVLAEGERTRIASRTVPSASLVAAILRRVATEARRRHRDTDPERVVLTHPARWHDTGPEVGRLRRAARDAGLGEVELVAEPVAAARHYAGTSRNGGAVAVYDLGGGTFDAAVLQPVDNGFTLAGPPGGDAHLGGEDFDAALMEIVEDHARAADPDAWTRVWEDTGKRADRDRALLRHEITTAKETLSERPTVDIYVPGLDHEVRVTRVEYEAAIEPLVSATLDQLDDTLTHAGTATATHTLYLTGSASRTPLISAMLTQRLGVLPVTQDDPKAVVAHGALTDPESATPAPTPPAPVTPPPPTPPPPTPPEPTPVAPVVPPPKRDDGRTPDPTPPRPRRRLAIVATVVALAAVVAVIIVLAQPADNSVAGGWAGRLEGETVPADYGMSLVEASGRIAETGRAGGTQRISGTASARTAAPATFNRANLTGTLSGTQFDFQLTQIIEAQPAGLQGCLIEGSLQRSTTADGSIELRGTWRTSLRNIHPRCGGLDGTLVLRRLGP